jgi:uncharacterized delta-60 repeat protein
MISRLFAASVFAFSLAIMGGTGLAENPFTTPYFPSANSTLLSVDHFSASGLIFGDLTLGFAPQSGTVLTVVDNTGAERINGAFTNLEQGRYVTASFAGADYVFQADYTGGNGNDLVLRLVGTGYYVHRFGADSNPGTAAQPFRTLQRAVNQAQPGDVITVAEGVYRETVTPPRSGTSERPILIRAADGAKVVVSGAEVVKGWQLAPGKEAVWMAPMPSTLGDRDQIFVDGVMMNWARWPNAGLDPLRVVADTKVTADTATLTTFPSSGQIATATITDPECNFPSGYWDGARIVIGMGANWLSRHGTVTHSEPGSFSFTFTRLASGTTVDTTYDPRAGNRYYLVGILAALDSPGEWFRDAGTSQLYLRTPASDSPDNHLVETKRRDLAFDLQGRSDIQLQGIGLFAARILTDGTSARIVIDGMLARYIYHANYVPDISYSKDASDSGIVLSGTGHVLKNSEIAHSVGNGVTLLGSGHRVDNCHIHDVNYLGSDAGAVNSGFNVELTNCEISNCTFHDSGKGLVVIRRLAASRIHHNLFYRSMLLTYDGGSIYTFQNDGANTEIDHNIICDTMGGDAGIYLDSGSLNFRVHHNLVFNAASDAMRLNGPATGILVFNNTLIAGWRSIEAWPYSSLPEYATMSGTEIRNNIFSSVVQTFTGASLSNNITSNADPLYADPSALDFTLSPGSPGLDAGMVLPPYTDGYVGTAPDIGAFESGVPRWTAGSSHWIPPAPSGLGAAPLADGNVLVSWTPPAASTLPLYLERADGGLYGSFKLRAILPPGTTSFADTPPSSSITYIYRIRQEGGPSGAYATIKPGRGVWETIEAEWLDAMAGVNVGSTTVGSCDNNDWVRFNGINFTQAISSVTFRLATSSSQSGNRVEVRLGSTTGQLIATHYPIATGSYGTYVEQTATITSSPSGSQDVFLVFKGGSGICNLDWFRFNTVASSASPNGAGNSLTATLSGTTAVRLQWISEGGGLESGWSIARSTDGVNFLGLADLAAGATSYDDTDLSFGGARWYRIRAVSRAGDSPWSNTASFDLRPGPATETTINALSNTTAHVTWKVSDPEPGTVSVIERATTADGSWVEIGRVNAAALVSGSGSFDDTLPVAGAAYYYRVVIEAPGPAGPVIRSGSARVVAFNEANHPPVAAADTYPGAIGGIQAFIPVLANDSDFDGDNLTITAVTQGALGTVALADNNIYYNATPGAVGTDSFTYTITDGFGGWATGSVTVTLALSDTQPPFFTSVPANVVAIATSTAGAVVNYPPAVANDNVGVASLAFSQASGTLFPVGTTTVTATATDTANNAATVTFTVTVRYPSEAGTLDVPFNENVIGGRVRAAVQQLDGRTIIAGDFTSVLGVTRNRIARLNADGSLDMSFNPNANSNVWSVVVQPDGRLLIGGEFSTLQPNGAPTATSRWRIARLNADGTVDPTFDPKASGRVYSLVPQPDGKILVAGQFSTLQPNGASTATTRKFMARLNPDGSLDAGFDPSVSGTWVNSVALQPDGKIVLGGQFSTLQPNGASAPTTRNNVARLNPDGTLDTTFDPNANNAVNAVAIQPDGRILICGGFSLLYPNGATTATIVPQVVRLNPDGTPDPYFIKASSGGNFWSAALQADGKILLSGAFTTIQPTITSTTVTRNRIVRLNADGSADRFFDPNADNVVYGVMLQPDGKVLLGGTFTSLQANGASSPSPCSFFARINNDPATQSVSVPDATQVLWRRGGSAPDVSQVTFELSADGGATWSALGSGKRVGATANWQLTDLSLPNAGQIRARGRAAGGLQNASMGLMESVASFSGVDARLQNLVISASTLSPTFNASTLTYTATVSFATSSVTITPSSVDPAAIIRLNGTLVSSGVTAGPVDLAVGANSISASVAAADGVNTLTYTVIITRQTAVQSWRQTYFSSPDNFGAAADTADPDGDGLTNILEFAFGLNPMQSGAIQLPQPQRVGGNYVVSFTEPAGVSGITYGAEWSTTLAPGSWQPITDTGSGSGHIFSVPHGDQPRMFFRFKITGP